MELWLFLWSPDPRTASSGFMRGIPECCKALRPPDKAMSQLRSFHCCPVSPYLLLAGISNFLFAILTSVRKNNLRSHTFQTTSGVLTAVHSLPVTIWKRLGVCFPSTQLVWRFYSHTTTSNYCPIQEPILTGFQNRTMPVYSALHPLNVGQHSHPGVVPKTLTLKKFLQVFTTQAIKSSQLLFFNLNSKQTKSLQ